MSISLSLGEYRFLSNRETISPLIFFQFLEQKKQFEARQSANRFKKEKKLIALSFSLFSNSSKSPKGKLVPSILSYKRTFSYHYARHPVSHAEKMIIIN